MLKRHVWGKLRLLRPPEIQSEAPGQLDSLQKCEMRSGLGPGVLWPATQQALQDLIDAMPLRGSAGACKGLLLV